jgi:hypothetical protein
LNPSFNRARIAKNFTNWLPAGESFLEPNLDETLRLKQHCECRMVEAGLRLLKLDPISARRGKHALAPAEE